MNRAFEVGQHSSKKTSQPERATLSRSASYGPNLTERARSGDATQLASKIIYRTHQKPAKQQHTSRETSDFTLANDFNDGFSNWCDSTMNQSHRQHTNEDSLAKRPESKEKIALNALKMLSMQGEPENPLEKEIEKIAGDNSQTISNKKIRVRSLSKHAFTTNEAAVQTANTQRERYELDPHTDELIDNSSLESFKMRGRNFLLLRQKYRPYPDSPSRLAHKFKLSPKWLKKKSSELDPRLKFFQGDDPNEQVDVSEKSSQITRTDSNAARVGTRSSSTISLREQVILQVNLKILVIRPKIPNFHKEKQNLTREGEALKIKPVRQVHDKKAGRLASSSPRSLTFQKDQVANLFPKLMGMD